MTTLHEQYDRMKHDIRTGYERQPCLSAKLYYCAALIVAFIILLNVPFALIIGTIALWFSL